MMYLSLYPSYTEESVICLLLEVLGEFLYYSQKHNTMQKSIENRITEVILKSL